MHRCFVLRVVDEYVAFNYNMGNPDPRRSIVPPVLYVLPLLPWLSPESPLDLCMISTVA